jgi:hypothetical protein
LFFVFRDFFVYFFAWDYFLECWLAGAGRLDGPEGGEGGGRRGGEGRRKRGCDWRRRARGAGLVGAGRFEGPWRRRRRREEGGVVIEIIRIIILIQ